MRVCVILTSHLRGGAEEYALDIARSAVRSGMDVHAALPESSEMASLAQDFRACGVRCYSSGLQETQTGLKRKIGHLVRSARALRFLISIKPDVALFVLPSPVRSVGPLLACAILAIPAAVSFQLVPFRIHHNRWTLRFYGWMRSRGQKWIAISENNRKLLSQSFQIQPAEISLIYNGALKTRKDHGDTARLRRELREELHLHPSALLLLTIGRLTPQKGYEDLLKIGPEVLREFPDARLLWAGDGELMDYFRQKIRERNLCEKIMLLGFRSDIPKLIAAADLFVFPTRFEGGSSIALLEAMTLGLPIVASNASGIPEVVENGIHGLLYGVGDCRELLTSIRWALHHTEEMKSMAENGRVRARKFSAERMESETLGLLSSLARKRGKRER
ncbi:MAG: glycosyltransferase family 4 protein [Syntrophobacteraceae bacterium]|nr:glycosyltransferase family 4 protein [Syntrophobacteraceae bacterium]